MYALYRELYQWELKRIKALKAFAREAFHLALFILYVPLKFLWGFLYLVGHQPKLIRQIEPGRSVEVQNDIYYQNIK